MSNESSLYRSPFSAGFWRTSAQQLHHVPSLVLAALFIALRLAVSSIQIPVADNLYIFFTYLVTSVGSMIYGPVLGLLTGFVTDILGYFLHPNGAFFLGYTIGEMLSGMVYALFFFRARISVLRVALCRGFVDVFVNVGLGCLWSAMLYGKGYYYYLVKSVVKNAVLLPIEVILLIVVLQMVIPLAIKARVIPSDTPKRIALWNRREARELKSGCKTGG